MANGKGYFVHVETTVVGDNTFYGFRVSLAHSDFMDVLYELVGLPSELLPLLVIDIPTEIPSVILEGTEIDNDSGGTFTAPADLNYAFSRHQTFHEAAKPTAPIEANVIIAQALMEESIAYYTAAEINGDLELPSGNDPDDYEPDENGWYYPGYDDFDFKATVVSQRSTGFQTASLDWHFNWVYNGCEDMDEDYHVMLTLDEATFNLNAIYTWTAAQYINCCNAGTDSGYLIESGGSGGSTYIQVWIFAPETDVARHYAEGLLTPVPKYDGLTPTLSLASQIIAALTQAGTRFANLPKIGPPIFRRPRGHLGQYPRGHGGQYPRGDSQL